MGIENGRGEAILGKFGATPGYPEVVDVHGKYMHSIMATNTSKATAQVVGELLHLALTELSNEYLPVIYQLQEEIDTLQDAADAECKALKAKIAGLEEALTTLDADYASMAAALQTTETIRKKQ